MNQIEVIPLRAFSDNYIWTLRDSSHAAVVDPGDAGPVLEYLRAERLELAAIINTHHHADHVGGNAELLKHYRVPVFGPHDERIREVTHRVGDGERITLSHFGVEFQVFEIPGHTRTHIAFYGAGMLFSGDTLFAVGCGKLFEGTPQQMYDSLSRLMQLPDDTRVYCGHEYTLSNIRFARAADPDNAALRELETKAAAYPAIEHRAGKSNQSFRTLSGTGARSLGQHPRGQEAGDAGSGAGGDSRMEEHVLGVVGREWIESP